MEPDAQTDERLHAPAHVIDLILGVMRQTPRPCGPSPGTVDYARAARAEARHYADQVWAEAFRAGAAWDRSHTRTAVRAARIDELTRDRG